jgi:hypothetical protein
MTAEDAFSSHANVEFSLAPGSQPPPPVPLPPTPICANALGYRY